MSDKMWDLFEKRFDRLDSKQDVMDTRLDDYNEQLAIHIESNKNLKTYVDKIDVRVKPLEYSHIIYSFIGKALLVGIPLTGAILGILWRLGLL